MWIIGCSDFNNLTMVSEFKSKTLLLHFEPLWPRLASKFEKNANKSKFFFFTFSQKSKPLHSSGQPNASDKTGGRVDWGGGEGVVRSLSNKYLKHKPTLNSLDWISSVSRG